MMIFRMTSFTELCQTELAEGTHMRKILAHRMIEYDIDCFHWYTGKHKGENRFILQLFASHSDMEIINKAAVRIRLDIIDVLTEFLSPSSDIEKKRLDEIVNWVSVIVEQVSTGHRVYVHDVVM